MLYNVGYLKKTQAPKKVLTQPLNHSENLNVTFNIGDIGEKYVLNLVDLKSKMALCVTRAYSMLMPYHMYHKQSIRILNLISTACSIKIRSTTNYIIRS